MKGKMAKRTMALLMALSLTVGAICPAGMSAYASEMSTTEPVKTDAAITVDTTMDNEPKLYDATTMHNLESAEIATAQDIIVAAGYGFDVYECFDGIEYNDNAVSVSYYEEKSNFNPDVAGDYETYYKVVPVSGKDSYLICRTISVREPDSAPENNGKETTQDKESDDDEESAPQEDELATGEIQELTMDSPMTFTLSSYALMKASAPATGTKDGKDSMKVAVNGYASYCGRSMGVKYISESGDYYKHLVYCLDMNKNSTSGTVSSSADSSNIKPVITYCLVNGARKLGGTCNNSAYSSGSATQDYFITGAAIHVLNGEVKLSYYDNGSGTYKKIAAMVADAKKHKDEYADNGNTISITYKISPAKTEWKDIGDGLYRSKDKFVRTKSGTITNVTYTLSGVPSGLTKGEIKTDASDIENADDLKKYDVCVAQTDASKASSNFYLYCNEAAMKKIQDNKSTIKIVAKAKSNEKGGRKWTPSVVSQQKITFLEEFNPVSAQATVKVTSNFKLGSLTLKKTNTYNGKPVSGAKYALYEDAACTELLCNMNYTDANGLSATGVEILTQSTYYLKETREPEGYQLDSTVYPIGLEYFTLYDSKGTVIQAGKEVSATELPEPVGVIVYKTDSTSKNVVKGAGFAVFTDAACTKRVCMDDGSEVPVFYYDEDLKMASSAKFPKKQDYYYVKEVVIPAGYRDDGKVYTVSPYYGEYEPVSAENTPIRCEVSAIKQDKETKEEKNGDAKLSGATYGLYAAENISYPDGRGLVTYTGTDNIICTKGQVFTSTGAQAKKDALLATVQTDEAYSFGFKNLYYGNYYIREIQPSEGYLLDNTAYTVNFRTAQNVTQDISLNCTVIETVKKQPFEIIKISTDGDDEETKKVEGAEFTVKLQSDIDEKGWEGAKTYDVLVTDKEGYAKSKELPYGTYLVKETKVPAELYKTDDFTVRVTEDSRKPQSWRILNDSPFKAYIRLVKKDAESGKTIMLSGATFKIKNTDKDVYVEQKVGDKKISEFTTDETGTVTTPLKLRYGNYAVEEIKAPEGYVISKESIPFVVTKEGAIQIVEDEDGDPVIEIEIKDTPVKGSITIHKRGEVPVGMEYDSIVDRIFAHLSGDERSVTFRYEEQNLSGAVFQVVAKENIYTPDHQTGEDGKREIAVINGIPATKGAVVATVTTDANGEAKIDNLPLGEYSVIEINPPEGFVICEEPVDVVLAYADQNTELVYGEADFVNARVKTKVSVMKTDEVTGYPVANAIYGIYAKEDIKAVNGGKLVPAQVATEDAIQDETVDEAETDENVEAESEDVEEMESDDEDSNEDDSEETESIEEESAEAESEEADMDEADEEESEILVEAGTLLDVAETDENGKAVFDADLPLGQYVIKEIEAPAGYLLDTAEYAVDLRYKDFTTEKIQAETTVTDTPILVDVSKTDITTGKELTGATLEILDSDGEVYATWITDGSPYRIHTMPAGTYTLVEKASPYGYLIANEVEFTVEETGEIQKVVMSDERVKGKIQIFKICKKTKEPLSGVEFELRDKDGKVLEKLTTDKVGFAQTGLLDICTYDEAGNFLADIPYYIVETKAADGYQLDDTPHEVVLQYDDSATETVVYQLTIKNKPTRKKLTQTGGKYAPWLFGLLGGALIGIGWYRRKKKR